MSLAHHFLTMAYNNAWANYRLLSTCCGLSQAEFVATRTSFFSSIKATLNHLLTVNWFYIDALERSIEREPLNDETWRFFEHEPFNTCAELQREQRQTDERLIEFCRSITEACLTQPVRIPRPDFVQTEQMSRLLSHLFQHQIHHRGQVHEMLAEQSSLLNSMSSFVWMRQSYERAIFGSLVFPSKKFGSVDTYR